MKNLYIVLVEKTRLSKSLNMALDHENIAGEAAAGACDVEVRVLVLPECGGEPIA